MTSAAALLKVLAQLFLLMLAGAIFRKANIINAGGRKLITDLVMDFFLPCSILRSFIGALDTVALGDMLNIVVISLGISLLGVVIGKFFRFRKADGSIDSGTNAVVRYGLICSSVTFMGSPMISAIFGSAGLVLWAVYMIPLRAVIWTYGTGIFSHAKGKDVVKDFLLCPCIIATVLGMLLMFLHISPPEFLMKTLASGAGCVTGLSMIVIGGLLAESRISEAFSRLSVCAAAVRLLVMPALVLGVTALLKLEPVVIGVSTALAGMPYAVSTAIFAEKYDANTKLAAQLVFVTTLFSVLTFTALMAIFNGLYPAVITP